MVRARLHTAGGPGPLPLCLGWVVAFAGRRPSTAGSATGSSRSQRAQPGPSVPPSQSGWSSITRGRAQGGGSGNPSTRPPAPTTRSHGSRTRPPPAEPRPRRLPELEVTGPSSSTVTVHAPGTACGHRYRVPLQATDSTLSDLSQPGEWPWWQVVDHVRVQVVSASRPEWILPFTGLQPAQFRKPVRVAPDWSSPPGTRNRAIATTAPPTVTPASSRNPPGARSWPTAATKATRR